MPGPDGGGTGPPRLLLLLARPGPFSRPGPRAHASYYCCCSAATAAHPPWPRRAHPAPLPQPSPTPGVGRVGRRAPPRRAPPPRESPQDAVALRLAPHRPSPRPGRPPSAPPMAPPMPGMNSGAGSRCLPRRPSLPSRSGSYLPAVFGSHFPLARHILLLQKLPGTEQEESKKNKRTCNEPKVHVEHEAYKHKDRVGPRCLWVKSSNDTMRKHHEHSHH
jgi:hypothetical protein